MFQLHSIQKLPNMRCCCLVWTQKSTTTTWQTDFSVHIGQHLIILGICSYSVSISSMKWATRTEKQNLDFWMGYCYHKRGYKIALVWKRSEKYFSPNLVVWKSGRRRVKLELKICELETFNWKERNCFYPR